MAGRVLNVEILTDRDNRSKGVATVQFEDPSMALNAICILCCLQCMCVRTYVLDNTVCMYVCMYEYTVEGTLFSEYSD